MPFLARFLLCLIPLYFLAPVDLLPDKLPYGFVDDTLILIAIAAIAKAIVPRSVFVDARKATAFGIVLLSVAGSVPNGQLPEFSKAGHQVCAEKIVIPETCDQQNIEAQNQFVREAIRTVVSVSSSLMAVASSLSTHIVCAKQDSQSATKRLHLALAPPIERKTLALTVRGGQHQLYWSNAPLSLLPDSANSLVFCRHTSQVAAFFMLTDHLHSGIESC